MEKIYWKSQGILLVWKSGNHDRLDLGLNADLWSCLRVISKRPKVPLTKMKTLTKCVNKPLQTHSVRPSAHHIDAAISVKVCSHLTFY